MPTEREKAYLVKFARVYSTIMHKPPKDIHEMGEITKQIRPLLEEFPEFRANTESLFFTARDQHQKKIRGELKLIKKRRLGFKFENGTIRIKKMPRLK